MSATYKYIIYGLFLLIVGYLSFNHTLQNTPLKINAKNSSNAFVVFELFTSQSCSSCPAANDHLKNLLKEIKEKNLPVYPLAFHVDYWNHLGWKDTFSKQKYTERQYRYAHTFSKLNIYTPQIVINGIKQFVGSDVQECTRTIISELKKDNSDFISLKAGYTLVENNIDILYEVDDVFHGLINFALIQKECPVSITAGENKGKDLTYFNIVREFAQTNCREKSRGKITFKKPDDISKNNLKVIVYLQNKVNMQIVNALEATLL